MSFVDHLEELRWHIIRALIAVCAFTLVAFSTMRWIFKEIILGPTHTDFWTYRQLCELERITGIPEICIDKIDFTLQSRNMAGQFTMHLTASFVIGFILAFPYIFWELWRFIKPGLHEKERKLSTVALTAVSFLFTIGIVFGYYVVAPMSINFLANYKLDESIANQFDVTSYISMLCMMVLGTGLMFQLPVIVYVLSKIGVITPKYMREYRKHAIVGIFVVAAVITPSPDPLSMMLVAVPLVLLYEISIFLSASVEKSKAKLMSSI
jgi:sec-independent protein translocase protein TatC